MGCAGKACCHRISITSENPTSRKNKLVNPYCRPMTLWSVVKMVPAYQSRHLTQPRETRASEWCIFLAAFEGARTYLFPS